MERSMEDEASSFESSEMLATFLASTPLITESWKLCGSSHGANAAAAAAAAEESFLVNRIGDVTYVAFSAGVGTVANSNWSNDLVPLANSAAAAGGLFWPLLHWHRHDEGQAPPVMVHSGLLNSFLSLFNTPVFQNQMLETLEKSKSVVFTGHSIAGAIASLSALWLLSYLQSIPSSFSVLCITFGSTLLGNESLSRAILQERWAGNFVHVVAKYDIVPRLLFAPLTPHLQSFLQFWHLSMTSPIFFGELAIHLTDNGKTELFHHVLASVENLTRSEEGAAPRSTSFWPFGNFVFCGSDGALCVDNGVVVVELLHVMLAMGLSTSSFEDHLKYKDYVGRLPLHLLTRRGFGFTEGKLPESNYEAGVALALQSAGIASHEPFSGHAKECLEMAKRMGRAPNLNSASLAIDLSKITPLRAQIEWYQASCDESEDQLGYYDSFKLQVASKRRFKVSMNRIRLGKFWDEVIQMLETNKLPHDFHKRAKWVNASQFYKLLVEPLDIAEYYRSGLQWEKGHYISHGREKRYEIFDRWWRERKVAEEENKKRSKFASLTQDSCFWARVEEAREWLEKVRSERDTRKTAFLWENIYKFEQYGRKMVESKEVSRDVVAKNSSYSLWVEELRELRLQLQQFPPLYPNFLAGEVVP